MLHRSSLGTVYLLKRTELAVRSCVEAALVRFDLTPTQFLILVLLDDKGPLSAAEIARTVGVRPQSVNEILAPLRAKRLIKRQVSAEHRRILKISLSATGAKLLNEAMSVAARLESELLASLGAEEIHALRRALEKILAQAERHECHPNTRRLAREEPGRIKAVPSERAAMASEARRRPASTRAAQCPP